MSHKPFPLLHTFRQSTFIMSPVPIPYSGFCIVRDGQLDSSDACNDLLIY